MNKGIVLHYLSMALLLSSALFVVPALVSLYYGEYYFLLIFLCVGAGMALAALPGALYRPKRRYMFAREGMVIAALMWIIFSAGGCAALLSQRQHSPTMWMRCSRASPGSPPRVRPF